MKKTQAFGSNPTQIMFGIDGINAEHGTQGDGADLGDTALWDGVHRNTAPINVTDFFAADQARETLVLTMRDQPFPIPDDRSMLRKPDMAGMPLRSNKFRPLTPPVDKSGTYEVESFDLASPELIQAVAAAHAASKAKPRPVFLTEGVMIRRRRAAAAQPRRIAA